MTRTRPFDAAGCSPYSRCWGGRRDAPSGAAEGGRNCGVEFQEVDRAALLEQSLDKLLRPRFVPRQQPWCRPPIRLLLSVTIATAYHNTFLHCEEAVFHKEAPVLQKLSDSSQEDRVRARVRTFMIGFHHRDKLHLWKAPSYPSLSLDSENEVLQRIVLVEEKRPLTQ